MTEKEFIAELFVNARKSLWHPVR